ncbi:hypothetical protein H2203_001928 [Taxawa tesnikishii (nom. ined.)]|nr:hypothetical protein H2203_001928 [Dothideales sp. JES 119]
MSVPTQMKAWQYSSGSGGLEKNLQLNTSAPLPPSAKSLAPDQTLVKIHSASINPVDHKLPELPVVSSIIIKKPATPGLDYAGEVVQTGSDTGLKAGQMVFGKIEPPPKFGTLAEYTVTPRAGTVPLPEGVSPDDAATVGVAGLVAYQAVKHAKAGDKIFINGGSGGTGTFGVQCAKAMGCYVTTTCSGPNVDLCKSLGADEVIDYKTQNVLEALKRSGKQYDLVVDMVGTPSELYWQCHHFTKPGAKFLQIGSQSSLSATVDLVSRFLWPGFLGGGQRPFQFVMTNTNYDDFEQIGRWMAEGKVKAVIDEKFAMGDAVKAFEKLKTGRARGKIVVKVVD